MPAAREKIVATDSQIRALPPMPEDVTYYKVTQAPNLYLRHNRSGSKLWVYQCRYAGKQLRVNMGKYPALGLAKARALAHETKEATTQGRHPDEVLGTVTAPARARTVGGVPTLRQISEEYFQHAKIGRKKDADTRATNRQRIALNILPSYGDYPITQCTPDMVLRMLETVAKNSPPMLVKIKSILSAIFEMATIKHADHLKTNPAKWQGALKEQLQPYLDDHHTESFFSLPPEEMPAFYAALKAQADNCRIRAGVAPLALMFTILTCARTEEVIGRWRSEKGPDGRRRKVITNKPMTWAEVDLTRGVWTIEGDRTKNGWSYEIPLSDDAAAVLREARRRVKPKGPQSQVFPSHMAAGDDLPSNNFMSAVIGRMGLVYPHVRQKRFGAREHLGDRLPTVHGMRSTCANWLASIGINDRLISHVLNHISDPEHDGSLGAYQGSQLLAQRSTLMQVWARYVVEGVRPRTWFDEINKGEGAV